MTRPAVFLNTASEAPAGGPTDCRTSGNVTGHFVQNLAAVDPVFWIL
jgi:hypothetical protein